MRVDILYLIVGALIAVGCGKHGGGSPSDATDPSDPVDATDTADATDAAEAPPLDGPIYIPGMPGLGAHGLNFYHYRAGSPSSIATPARTTQASGSTIVVSIGRGDKSKFVLPTDNKGNAPYVQQGQVHPYLPYYPDSGTALYTFTSAGGGPGFQVSTSTPPDDEITIAAVEVVEGSRIQAVAWNMRNTVPITSERVTTTGPATLIAFWWGDGFPGATPQTAKPNNGFAVVDTNVQELHSFIQVAVAVKNVTAAGTYDVTWTATPAQGAQLWLVAVQ